MSARPASLTIAAAIEALEGVVVFGAGVFVGVETLVGHPSNVAGSAALAVLALLGALALLAVAAGLFRVRRWGRAPAVLTQILAIPVAVSMIQARQYGVGVPLVAAAVVGLVTLFSRPTGRALLGE